MRTAILMPAGLLLTFMAVADEAPTTYNRINLSVSAEERVANDIVTAELYSEREGEQASRVASEVNQDMAWALDLAQSVEEVSVQTTGYFSQPVYQKQIVVGWRVRQSIRLEAQDAARLSELIGELQQRLAMASIRYTISPDSRSKAEDGLIARALAAFDQRAQLVTTELGRTDYRIVHLDVVTSATPPRPIASQRMMHSMEAAADVSAPVIESGVQTVRVGVNGIIELLLN